ncbi:MAG: bifunctional riboflavin kinase/FAD synthetase [Gammaproteobacteria bacterium]|nr:bifunctional riboflavin kinase/FAD synthetase [Gammaproteobacteria bacterium]
MELIRGLHNLKDRHRGCAVSIGNFDGVHLGHKAVLDQLAVQARRLEVPALVMLFEPQPAEYFAPERAPVRLTRLREKLRALDGDAVDQVLCVRFDAAFSHITADSFVRDILHRRLGARHVLVGDDFRFGKGRAGDLAFLSGLAPELGFTVGCRDTFEVDGERVSSTRVRAALQAGDLELARRLLGYDYNLYGRVAHGDKRGRTIGFPTANVHLHRLKVPVSGVFAVRLHCNGAAPLLGVANLGHRPTVRGNEPVPLLEVHLLDYDGDLYGRHVRVDFLKHLRDERRFESFDALKAQIEDDVTAARRYFATSP